VGARGVFVPHYCDVDRASDITPMQGIYGFSQEVTVACQGWVDYSNLCGIVRVAMVAFGEDGYRIDRGDREGVGELIWLKVSPHIRDEWGCGGNPYGSVGISCYPLALEALLTVITVAAHRPAVKGNQGKCVYCPQYYHTE